MINAGLDARVRCAEPVIERIVHSRLRSAHLLQDREDVRAEATLDLVRKLRDAPDDVRNIEAYAAIVAQHACDRYFRARYPQRHRLKNRLRYLMANDNRYALWTAPDVRLLCGFAAWKDRDGVAAQPVSIASESLPAVAEAAFRAAAGPLLLDDLVEIAAAVLGIRDGDTALDTVTLPSKSRTPEQRLDQRRWFATLWQEITLLPLAQRIALLLHLRDERGGPALPYFPAAGAASMRQIASAMELTLEELAALWPTLPWNDLAIAQRLTLTRQQVINLRASARQRLARRCPNPP
ncbi:MAG: hypothetical protein JNK48_06565 [Bryobacterales bacterium]|nr:hypothetical protein [Bryobacterales bacterium]